jgi:UDP-N-acetylglucosamine 1-carboxyvinyltransferase
MNTTIKIKGGKPLQGTIKIAPNKNAILPALLASILTDETMTYKRVPRSPDVEKILAALRAMGATVISKEETVTICCRNLATSIVPNEIINEMQAGYLFAGPLLARFGKASIPPSSGCQLGYRGYEDHAEYLKKLCVEVTFIDIHQQKYIHFNVMGFPKDCPIVSDSTEGLYEQRKSSYNNPLVTPTENILMFLAGMSRFDTEIGGIAQEPHVVQLIELLQKMGAQIKGKGSTIKIRNPGKLKGVTFVPGPDHVDYFGFVITAAMTKSDLHLQLPVTESIEHMNEFIKDIGIVLEIKDDGVTVIGSESSYKPSSTFPRANDANTYKMNPGPWPMFPIDCLPSFVAWSTLNQNPETSTFSNNWMYDNGIEYVPVMQQMGARILSFDRQRVTTGGIANSHPYRSTLEVSAPQVIEGVRAIISCALSGGDHTIHNAQYILRRNPNFFEVLKNLGADITVL